MSTVLPYILSTSASLTLTAFVKLFSVKKMYLKFQFGAAEIHLGLVQGRWSLPHSWHTFYRPVQEVSPVLCLGCLFLQLSSSKAKVWNQQGLKAWYGVRGCSSKPPQGGRMSLSVSLSSSNLFFFSKDSRDFLL